MEYVTDAEVWRLYCAARLAELNCRQTISASDYQQADALCVDGRWRVADPIKAAEQHLGVQRPPVAA